MPDVIWLCRVPFYNVSAVRLFLAVCRIEIIMSAMGNMRQMNSCSRNNKYSKYHIPK